MFTGIVENLASLSTIKPMGTGKNFRLESSLASSFKIDQSVSHNGVCLTVTKVEAPFYEVIAVEETLLKTNLGNWTAGQFINLERSLIAGGRLDGHMVQGHVDQTGICTKVDKRDGSWLFDFSFEPVQPEYMPVEKGSICINGVSLTVFDATERSFRVTVIPYTFEHTDFKHLQQGDAVNLEFDMIGKYIYRFLKQAGRL